MSIEAVSRGEHTRDEILAAAFKLFLERGYHGTSMRQIADRARIAVGGIYNHFKGKDDIFLAVLVERHPYQDILPALNAAQGETVEEFVRDAARRMVGVLGERQDFLNLMFIELVEFNSQHIPQLFGLYFPQVMDFAQRFLQSKSELRPIPTSAIVRAFIGLFFSYIITELLIGSQLPPSMQENTFDYFVDIYLHGILAESK